MSPFVLSRLEQRLALSIRSQLLLGRDLIRVDEGLMVGREHAQAIVAALELSCKYGADFELVSRDRDGEWSAHLICPLGRFQP